MKSLPSIFVATIIVLISGVARPLEIPAGTVLPIMMNTGITAGKGKIAERISGRLMQDVILPSGEKIRAGARIRGQVLQSSGGPGDMRIAVRFDRLMVDGKQVPLTVSLLALASPQEVFDAQLPVGSFDEFGTTISDWTTVQVGGAAVYLGDGTVRDGMQIIGKAPGHGIVTAKLLPAPKRGCKSIPAESQNEQSLWVFSPWACGTYGLDDLKISHHGVTSPVGTIELSAPSSVHIRAGSGWLLRVVPSDAPAGPTSGN
jgi:hypothetical protein